MEDGSVPESEVIKSQGTRDQIRDQDGVRRLDTRSDRWAVGAEAAGYGQGKKRPGERVETPVWVLITQRSQVQILPPLL